MGKKQSIKAETCCRSWKRMFKRINNDGSWRFILHFNHLGHKWKIILFQNSFLKFQVCAKINFRFKIITVNTRLGLFDFFHKVQKIHTFILIFWPFSGFPFFFLKSLRFLNDWLNFVIYTHHILLTVFHTTSLKLICKSINLIYSCIVLSMFGKNIIKCGEKIEQDWKSKVKKVLKYLLV